jgi:TfoX/Sxy family transcriptional regulator of competence genes
MSTSPSLVLDLLDRVDLEGLRARPMFGEHGVYLGDRMVGVICDGRFFVKNVAGSRAALPGVEPEAPFPGAKNAYLPADEAEPEAIRAALSAALAELPPTKKRKPKA